MQLAPQNDESNRKLASAAMEDALPPDDDGTKRPKDRQTLLLGSTQSASKALTDPTLSVCAFDPHSGTVYALVDNDTAKTSASDNSAALEESKEGPPTTKAPPPGILQMPAALTIATEGAGTGLSAEPVDEAAGSHPTASSTSPCDFSPLQDLNAAVAEHDPFARAMTGAAAESSNKSDRVSATNFLRFSPTFSSNNVVITNNGKFASSSALCSLLSLSSSLARFYCARQGSPMFVWTVSTLRNLAQIKLVKSKLVAINHTLTVDIFGWLLYAKTPNLKNTPKLNQTQLITIFIKYRPYHLRHLRRGLQR